MYIPQGTFIVAATAAGAAEGRKVGMLCSQGRVEEGLDCPEAAARYRQK